MNLLSLRYRDTAKTALALLPLGFLLVALAAGGVQQLLLLHRIEVVTGCLASNYCVFGQMKTLEQARLSFQSDCEMLGVTTTPVRATRRGSTIVFETEVVVAASFLGLQRRNCLFPISATATAF